MEKTKRLKLYSEKDYTETIDFPVELIGRDGVVRKYSYAESIRIYERRIESAHIRYSDREIINAEIYHCSKRLEQIKRSWKQRISSSEREYLEGRPVLKDRELFERGKMFLRAYLERLIPGLDARGDLANPNLVNLEERADCQVFYVSSPVFHPGTLLYVYRLESAGGEDLREQYLRYVEILRFAEQAADTEKLVHHEGHTDMGFILTSPRQEPLVKLRELPDIMAAVGGGAVDAALPENLSWLEALLNRGETPDDGPYRQGLEELRRSNFEAAFSCFREALEANPFYKEAYWALAALTDHLGRWQEAEPYLLMALKYFPDEPMAHFHHGQLSFRRKQWRPALAAFKQAVKLNARQSRVFGYLACTQALMGRYRAAAETLERGLRIFPRDRSLLKLAIPLHRGLRWQGRLLAVSIVLATVVLTVGLMFEPLLGWAAGAVLAGVLIALNARQQVGYRRLLLEWAKSG